MTNTIGKSIKQIRENKGYSQKYVACFLEISNSTLSKYENDLLEPNLDTLKKLAYLYHTSLDFLTGFYNDKSKIRSVDKKDYFLKVM